MSTMTENLLFAYGMNITKLIESKYSGEETMNHPIYHANKHRFWKSLPFLALMLCLPVHAATTASTAPTPGSYCPGTEILLVVAEELSVSLDLAMRSKAATLENRPATAVSDLTAAGTTLRLASSRGAAARTVLLIDATLQAKTGADYTQMLSWFPLLQKSLQTLPNDATESAAAAALTRAEDNMQNPKKGNPLTPLREARHLLACDSLDIPLQAAMQAQHDLIRQLGRNDKLKSGAYDRLIDSLRRALSYALDSQ